jgi:hypothetical protein
MAIDPMRTLAILALLVGGLLAGCSSPSDDTPSETGPTFDDLGLEATSETGVIRGVVVDEAVRPIAGATVALQGADPREAVTTALGTFGFDGLAAGTYFFTVGKAGFVTAQSSADVVPGLAEPDVVKVQLTADAATRPYVDTYVFSGFVECMTPNVALCGLVNDLAGEVTHDNSQVVYELSRVPTWVQTEMIWRSTQAAGGEMSVMYSYGDCGGFFCDHEAAGPSPLLLVANETDIATIGLGDGTDLYIRTFTKAMPGTEACFPAGVPEVGGACTGPAGLTLEQGFEYYTHVFYGYQPPEGWRFSSGDPVPQPEA